jgi:hypothetical protein
MPTVTSISTRPRPSTALFEALAPSFVPDSACEQWIRATFIDPDSKLFNEEHLHLQMATIGVLWTTVANQKHMNDIAGQCEAPFFQGNKWSKARQEQQFMQWFGILPNFVLTFDAHYALKCSDATWCALVEHELYHCGQAKNEFGEPKFTRDGIPVFAIRGHDVEEFVGVVRRYGVGAAAGKTRELIEAGRGKPSVMAADISAVCGNCN